MLANRCGLQQPDKHMQALERRAQMGCLAQIRMLDLQKACWCLTVYSIVLRCVTGSATTCTMLNSTSCNSNSSLLPAVTHGARPWQHQSSVFKPPHSNRATNSGAVLQNCMLFSVRTCCTLKGPQSKALAARPVSKVHQDRQGEQAARETAASASSPGLRNPGQLHPPASFYAPREPESSIVQRLQSWGWR